MATSSSIRALGARGGQRELVISRVYGGQQNLDLERVERQHAYCVKIVLAYQACKRARVKVK